MTKKELEQKALEMMKEKYGDIDKDNEVYEATFNGCVDFIKANENN